MVWLVTALLSAVVTGVGLWRGTPNGLAAEAITGAAGVLFSLVVFRVSTLSGEKDRLRSRGGWPLSVAGAASLTAALAGGVDVVVWLTQRHSILGPWGALLAAAGFVMNAVSALRLSLDSSRRTQFYLLAVASLVSGAIAVSLFVQVSGINTTP